MVSPFWPNAYRTMLIGYGAAAVQSPGGGGGGGGGGGPPVVNVSVEFVVETPV
jgi:hypothetical protein